MRGHVLRLRASVLVAIAASVSVAGASAANQPRAGPERSSVPAAPSPLGGFSARVTFTGTPFTVPPTCDGGVGVWTPPGSPFTVQQLAPASGGWVVAPSQGDDAGGAAFLLNDAITEIGASFDVVNPSTGQSGLFSFGSDYGNGCNKQLPPFIPAGGSVHLEADQFAFGCGTVEWARSGLTFTLTVTLRPDDCRSPSYLALGDDFSSGEGNPPFDPTVGSCDRSNRSWPAVFSSQMEDLPNSASGWVDLGNLACSGATSADISASFRGQRSQLDTTRALNPNFATVTIGWNDVGMDKLLATCFAANCIANGAVAKASARISRLAGILPALYEAISATASGRPMFLFVVGYPRLFPIKPSSTTGCRWLTAKEQTGLNKVASKFDSVLRSAVRNATKGRIFYASMLNTLAGHEMCTRKPWIFRLGRPGGGQPTVKGQQAIATAMRHFFLGDAQTEPSPGVATRVAIHSAAQVAAR